MSGQEKQFLYPLRMAFGTAKGRYQANKDTRSSTQALQQEFDLRGHTAKLLFVRG